MLFLRAGDTLSDNARSWLEKAFATGAPTGILKTAWEVKEQVRVLLRTGSFAYAELAKAQLEKLVHASTQPKAIRLWRKEIEALILIGGKVAANITAINRTAVGHRNPK